MNHAARGAGCAYLLSLLSSQGRECPPHPVPVLCAGDSYAPVNCCREFQSHRRPSRKHAMIAPGVRNRRGAVAGFGAFVLRMLVLPVGLLRGVLTALHPTRRRAGYGQLGSPKPQRSVHRQKQSEAMFQIARQRAEMRMLHIIGHGHDAPGATRGLRFRMRAALARPRSRLPAPDSSHRHPPPSARRPTQTRATGSAQPCAAWASRTACSPSGGSARSSGLRRTTPPPRMFSGGARSPSCTSRAICSRCLRTR